MKFQEFIQGAHVIGDDDIQSAIDGISAAKDFPDVQSAQDVREWALRSDSEDAQMAAETAEWLWELYKDAGHDEVTADE